MPGLERPPAVEIPAYLARGGAPVRGEDRHDEAGDEAPCPRQRRALVAGASGGVRRPGERRRDAGAGAARSRRPRRPGNGRRERAGCRRGRVRVRPSDSSTSSAGRTTRWRRSPRHMQAVVRRLRRGDVGLVHDHLEIVGRRRWPLSAPSPRRRCTRCTGIRSARRRSTGSSTGGAGSGSTACRTPSWHWRRPSCDSVTRRRPAGDAHPPPRRRWRRRNAVTTCSCSVASVGSRGRTWRLG